MLKRYGDQRYYDPVIGRFLSVDPMPSDSRSGWNFNRYNYAANSPSRFVDPDGREIKHADGSTAQDIADYNTAYAYLDAVGGAEKFKAL